MSKIETAIHLLKHGNRDFVVACFNKIMHTRIFNWMHDKDYLEMVYMVRFGNRLNLNTPSTFNEKLNWLKLYDRKSIYTKMVDKYEAKQYVAAQIGAQYTVPSYGIYDTFDEIDFSLLPNKFVIKCTHDSGSAIICKAKSQFNRSAARRKIISAQKHNLFYWAREWPYYNVKRRILIEEYLEPLSGNLIVYKVFCFSGEPRIIQVIQNDKTENETVDYYSLDWELLNMRQDYPNSKHPIPKPKALAEIIELSGRFLLERPFLRVDWYIVNDHPIFSEFTFFSDAGFARFEPKEWDEMLGDYMVIPIDIRKNEFGKEVLSEKCGR